MPEGIDIVIVNYFSLKKIERLLDSIFKSALADIKLNVMIISNSNEAGFDTLPFKENIFIKINDKNYGYGRACNEALEHCRYDYLLVLNPDTILFERTLIDAYRFMKAEKNITVLGVKHIDANNKTAPSCSRFPQLKNYLNDIFGLSKINPSIFKGGSLMHDWDHLASQFVDQVMGAFMLVRKTFIDEYGFMDERFFVFGEDMDFCKKVWMNNGTVYYNAAIAIIHEGMVSTENASAQKLCYSLEGKLKFAHKYFSRFNYFILLCCVIAVEPFTRMFFFMIKGRFKSVENVLKGYYLFYKRREFK